MRSHGSSLWGFPDNIIQGWFKTKTTIAIMSDNREKQVMLYFTDEVFCR